MSNNFERQRAKSALAFIIPILEEYNFRWIITGGFACYVYGVNRMLTDIDIDIDTDKDSTAFSRFLTRISPYISQPLENFVDENYDNYNFEISYNDQIIDICPMANLKIYNNLSAKYEAFYNDGFPVVELVNFEGFTLPLLNKRAIINNKEQLRVKDKWQQRDIDELYKLLELSQ